MNNSRRLACAAIVFVMVSTAGIDVCAAQPSGLGQDATPSAPVTGVGTGQFRPRPFLAVDVPLSRASVSARTATPWQGPASVPQASAPRKQRSTKRKVFGAIVGATGGFFIGGYLGAAIEGDCNCDDPGLKGAVIGAPIGAAAGGILGYKFLF
jgi:hypothetical protein